MFSLVVSLEG